MMPCMGETLKVLLKSNKGGNFTRNNKAKTRQFIRLINVAQNSDSATAVLVVIFEFFLGPHLVKM